MAETKVDGDQQEYILQPQRGRDAIRQRLIWRTANIGITSSSSTMLRLRRLLSTVRAPNLVKVLDTPTERTRRCSTIISFPGPRGSAHPSCTNVEAKEFGSFAGDWVCMALLLEKGRSRTSAVQSVTDRAKRARFRPRACPPRGQADDSDDVARRSVMMVLPFSDTELIGEHPKIFVANGTHSLYLMAGTFAVATVRAAPYSCGRVEPPTPTIQRSPSRHGGAILLRQTAWRSSLPRCCVSDQSVAMISLKVSSRLTVWTSWAGSRPRTTSPAHRAAARWCGRRICAVPEGGVRPQNWISEPARELGTSAVRPVVDREKQPWWPGDSPVFGLSGSVGTAGGERSLRQARRHEVPDVLADVLPRLCQGKDSEDVLTNA